MCLRIGKPLEALCALRTTSSGLGPAKSKASVRSCPKTSITSNFLAGKWLGWVFVERVASPTMMVANVDGDARRSTGAGGCFSLLPFIGPSVGNDGAAVALGCSFGLCVSREGLPWPVRFPNRAPLVRARSPPPVSVGLCSLPLPDNLSSNDREPLLGSPGGAADVTFPASGVSGEAFSASFFLRAAANAANFDTFPPLSGAPPRRPSRGYKGSISISAFRCDGTFNHGESRKNSAAEKGVEHGEETYGAGYPDTINPVRKCPYFLNTVSWLVK